MPATGADISCEHVEACVVHLLESKSASTANTRYRGLQQFFRWLLEEDEIDRSPMEYMTPPIPESKSDVLAAHCAMLPARFPVRSLRCAGAMSMMSSAQVTWR
jgi:hypothetical protein